MDDNKLSKKLDIISAKLNAIVELLAEKPTDKGLKILQDLRDELKQLKES